ncbi:adenosine deaminase family protein [Actinokineospora sp.]|uniref:adenosine deaminase family protein n=1 Tax=Actinokineospora sp. TaxID=1872133 RepID=UPI003D6C6E91
MSKIQPSSTLGPKAVVHAGETTGPDTIWSALRDLRADRIGHGTSATRDPELMTHLVEHAIPVEVCVSSNMRTNSVPDLASHPVAEMLGAGMTVCVATDDPGMFDTDLDREYRLIADLAGLDVAGVRDLARAGVAASYAPDSLKRGLTDRIADIRVQEPLLGGPND